MTNGSFGVHDTTSGRPHGEGASKGAASAMTTNPSVIARPTMESGFCFIRFRPNFASRMRGCMDLRNSVQNDLPATRSLQPNPGVDVRVHDVDDEVRNHEEERVHECEP